jgi:uncharacterized iron-regulated membrane protein
MEHVPSNITVRPRNRMFNEVKIRRWHRVVGVIIAPLLFAQAISGLVIAFEVLLGIHGDVAKLIGQETGNLQRAWDFIFLEIHYGGGFWGNIYHSVLVLGTIWMIISGITIFERVRRRQKKSRPNL